LDFRACGRLFSQRIAFGQWCPRALIASWNSPAKILAPNVSWRLGASGAMLSPCSITRRQLLNGSERYIPPPNVPLGRTVQPPSNEQLDSTPYQVTSKHCIATFNKNLSRNC
jgi:hypothetical protein